ncbi:protein NCBP2AS2 homolog [Oppia nitens]|uniref:protein NCBP2AS2 homolog n=1 Tax=Oppia nitens TaxID=1686743 RepID=UPI0023DB08C4|nr:protein NCBP2AS2 homolog [Oppia nitens]
MVFRIVYRVIYGFIGNDRVVERLAQSTIIRRSAQLTARWLTRGRQAVEDSIGGDVRNKQEVIDDLLRRRTADKTGSFGHRFVHRFRRELKDQFNEAKEELGQRRHRR